MQKTHTQTVLVVEDHEQNRKLLHDLLEINGFNALCATSGTQGVQLAKEYRPHLILMDIQLPEISGIEALRRIRNDSHCSAVPIVAITAFAMKGEEEKIRNAGFDDYISKPLVIEKFLSVIRSFLPPSSPFIRKYQAA